MKVLKFVMFLFYKYYAKGGTKRIPYFSALCAIVFLIYIHIFQILIILNEIDLLPINKDDERIEKYGKIALFLLPIFMIIAFLVKPNDLKKASYSESDVHKGNIHLIIYIISSVILLFALIILIPRSL